MEINDQRRRQLIKLLKETYDLIGQLEGRGLYVTDPLERRRLQKEADDLKGRADEWNAELTRLENPTATPATPPPNSLNEARIEKEQTELSELRQEFQAASGPGVGVVSPVGDVRLLRVFLCHSKSDKVAVRELYNRLLSDGLQPWLDEEALLPGQRWQVEIPKAVRASDVVLVCLSPGSINHAGYVNKEISYALDVALEQPEDIIYVIPVCLVECVVPERLAVFHWVNLFEPGGYERLRRAFQFRAEDLGLEIEPSVTTPDAQSSTSTTLRPLDSITAVADHDTRIAVWLAELEEAESKKDWGWAVELGQKILKLEPEHQVTRHKMFCVYLGRGNIFLKLKQYEMAIEDYSRAIKLNPDDNSVYLERAQAYVSYKQYELAIQDYNKAIELKPNDAFAYNSRGNAYNNLKQYKQAIREYNRAIKLDPNNASAYNNRGNTYLNLKQYEMAIEDYDLTISLDAKLALAYRNRGNAYASLSQSERAINDYNQAIKLDPTDAFAYYNRGNAYLNLKQYEQAIGEYNRIIELNSNFANAYHNRGYAYAELKQYERAIRDYTLTIELDPNFAPAYNNRGSVYVELQQYTRAIKDYNKAIELDPNYVPVFHNRAVAYSKLGNETAAQQDRQWVQQLQK